MSFSGKIKEELAEQYAKARHCNLAELSAIIHMAGGFSDDRRGVCCVHVHTEKYNFGKKSFTIFTKKINI